MTVSIPKVLRLREAARAVVDDTDWETTFYDEQRAVPKVSLLVLDIAIMLDGDGGAHGACPRAVENLREAIEDVCDLWDWSKYLAKLTDALDEMFGKQEGG